MFPAIPAPSWHYIAVIAGFFARRSALGLSRVMLLWAGLATPALAERAALLPLEGSGLLSKTREDLDDDLRKALAGSGIAVQPKDATIAQIDEAQSAGLNCPTLTDACARRVGAVAEVDTVFRASVETVDDKMVLAMTRIDVRADVPARRVAGQLQLPAIDGGKSMNAIVQRVLTGKGSSGALPFDLQVAPNEAELLVDGKRVVPGVLWLAPGAHAVKARAPDHADLDREIVVRDDGMDNQASLALTPLAVPVMLYVGLGLLGLGGVALVGGGAGAGVAEWSLYSVQPYAQRERVQTLGRGALVAITIGAVAAVIGGVFTAVGAE
jgi:hypothetical protein